MTQQLDTDSYDLDTDPYDAAGYGMTEIGFGRKAAVLVVDFQKGFTDPAHVGGRSPYMHDAVNRATEVLAAARALGVPVLHTVVEYDSRETVGNWKSASLQDFTAGTDMVQVDPRVWEDSDVLVKKRFPSAFFGTDVASILRYWDVDTVVLMGCTTSGCLRASVIDSFSHGFRTIVAGDACGDHDVAAHEGNLADVHRRYADVMTAVEVVEQLARVATA